MRRFPALVLGLLLALAWTACVPSALGPIPLPPSKNPGSPPSDSSRTYYVRPDGGSTKECTGLADVPYPGSGSHQSCAWDHPFRALQPSGEPNIPGTVRITGGDTLIIASGSYTMGMGAPGAATCQSDYPQQCYMAPIPSGPDPAHPTRILGEGWDARCADPPELWGRERPWMILNLTDASNIEVACLEITDHSGCVEDHSGEIACKQDAYPHGDWASWGVYAEDSVNVSLRHLDIHGMADSGVRAARLADWTVEDVRIAGNGWSGWNGDIQGDDSNSGTLTFRRWVVEWNGCGETYPGREPTGCWGQSAGGYGDGVGTGATGGDWIIEDSAFLHNTSDGLDLLYHVLGGSITMRRTLAEGNGGNQIKTGGPTHLENVIAVGNCGFFDGKPFTHNVDHCRALGNVLEFHPRAGNRITVVNSTVTGEGDCLAIAECAAGETCDGSESILVRNSIFQGHPQFGTPADTTCLTWSDPNLPSDPFAIDYTVVTGVKQTPEPCPPQSFCDISSGLMDPSIDSFDAHLKENSPAVDAGTEDGAPQVDFDGEPRDAQPDIGADERWHLTAEVFLPLILYH